MVEPPFLIGGMSLEKHSKIPRVSCVFSSHFMSRLIETLVSGPKNNPRTIYPAK